MAFKELLKVKLEGIQKKFSFPKYFKFTDTKEELEKYYLSKIYDYIKEENGEIKNQAIKYKNDKSMYSLLIIIHGERIILKITFMYDHRNLIKGFWELGYIKCGKRYEGTGISKEIKIKILVEGENEN